MGRQGRGGIRPAQGDQTFAGFAGYQCLQAFADQIRKSSGTAGNCAKISPPRLDYPEGFR